MFDLQEFVFSNLSIKAAKNDMIGFTLIVGLLTKVFAAASAIEAEQVTVLSSASSAVFELSACLSCFLRKQTVTCTVQELL
jgi:hypothetical protein